MWNINKCQIYKNREWNGDCQGLGGGWRKWGDVAQSVQTSSKKITELWGSNVHTVTIDNSTVLYT